MTKVTIATGTLPASTNASIGLVLKGINHYASFKDTLSDNVKLLEEHGGEPQARKRIFSRIPREAYIPTSALKNL